MDLDKGLRTLDKRFNELGQLAAFIRLCDDSLVTHNTNTIQKVIALDGMPEYFKKTFYAEPSSRAHHRQAVVLETIFR
ncbi:hypothetical protein B9Z55_000039 [Caenorhabditis nigoni]|uniref:Uncharacterized protein n=1 Tax=Caenorhabditis nigoni TaxID=1611254 RepID=A0A2G5VSN9_9PELO|nr:hypothetical protein B9Z55_000039 [Caenorhabditis nigoni]